MSLDIYLERVQPTAVYTDNITHNLNEMAAEAGLYGPLWHPEQHNIAHASDLIAPLERGIAAMRADPERFRKHDATNGWGTYENFQAFCERVLVACREYPDATVKVWR